MSILIGFGDIPVLQLLILNPKMTNAKWRKSLVFSLGTWLDCEIAYTDGGIAHGIYQ